MHLIWSPGNLEKEKMEIRRNFSGSLEFWLTLSKREVLYLIYSVLSILQVTDYGGVPAARITIS